MADIQAIRDELNADPLARGYSGMSDQQAADDLNAETREIIRSTLTGSTIFNAIVPSEFTALSADQQQFVRDVFSLGDSVDVGPNTNARDVLLGAFGNGTTTRDNLVAAVTFTQSRAQELNLKGSSPEIGPAHVQQARAL